MNELSLIDSLFNDVLDSTPSVMYRAGVSAPRVDVTEDEGAYTLEMELPGRTENDVNIELDHDNLTISSKVCEEKESKEDKKDTTLGEKAPGKGVAWGFNVGRIADCAAKNSYRVYLLWNPNFESPTGVLDPAACGLLKFK